MEKAVGYGFLSRRELAEHFPDSRWTFGMKDHVRFREVDSFQHVNNTACMSWFETMRVRMLAETGLLPDGKFHLMPVLRAATIEYLAPIPAYVDYVVLSRISRIGRTSLTFDYEVVVAGKAMLTSTAVVVVVDPESGVPVALPEALRESLLKDHSLAEK